MFVYMTSIQREGQQTKEITYNNDNCVGCGIYSQTCPNLAINMGPLVPIARGILNMNYITMNKNKCVLYGLYLFYCPFNAIEFNINGLNVKNLKKYSKWDPRTEINENNCIFCGKCEIYCPKEVISVKRNLLKYKDLVAEETRVKVDECINCYISEEMCSSGVIKVKHLMDLILEDSNLNL